MSWASRRKTLIFLIIFGVFLAIALPIVYSLYPKASCTDGEMNQDERGVDCGGVCEQICSQDIFPASVLWSRSFKVSPGVYNAAAFISNPNLELAAEGVPYTFEMYDDRNVLILNYRGKAFIPAGAAIPIFAGGINTGEREVYRTLFSFEAEPSWKKVTPPDSVKILQYDLKTDTDIPRLEASVRNDTVRTISEVQIIAVIYDAAGNAITSSSTFIDSISPDEERNIIFTWREPFSATPSRVELYPITL